VKILLRFKRINFFSTSINTSGHNESLQFLYASPTVGTGAGRQGRLIATSDLDRWASWGQGRTDMKYFALIYYVVDSFVSRRTQFREEHLRLVGEANRRGQLLLAGALGDPVDRALLVFRTQDRSIAEDFARNDPYVINGLVTRWEVQPWAIVIGSDNTTFKGGVK
jgi:uncharacterized protein YciI